MWLFIFCILFFCFVIFPMVAEDQNNAWYLDALMAATIPISIIIILLIIYISWEVYG